MAFAKVAACYLKITYRNDLTFLYNETKVTAAELGENASPLTIRRWEQEEYKHQLERMEQASKKEGFVEWLEAQRNARNKFFATYQDLFETAKAYNDQSSKTLLAGARFASTAQYTAEAALILGGLGVFDRCVKAGTAMRSGQLAKTGLEGLSLYQTVGLKFALGFGTGMSISVAETWADAKNADIVMMGDAVADHATAEQARDAVGDGVRGGVDDLFTETGRNMSQSAWNDLRASLTQGQQRYGNGFRPATAARLNQQAKARFDARNTALLGKYLKGTLREAVGESAKCLGYLVAIKSGLDSTTKFWNHWNGEL